MRKDSDNEKIDKFIPWRIHEDIFFDYWKNSLEASPWVLSILQLGYKIPFDTIPPEYEEQNNATAREQPEVVRKIVEEMIELKIVTSGVGNKNQRRW